MEREAGKKQGKTAADGREARLKAALKANLARRKGQAKLRASADQAEADAVDNAGAPGDGDSRDRD